LTEYEAITAFCLAPLSPAARAVRLADPGTPACDSVPVVAQAADDTVAAVARTYVAVTESHGMWLRWLPLTREPRR